MLTESHRIAGSNGLKPGRFSAEEPKIVDKDRKPFSAGCHVSINDPIAELGFLDDYLIFAKIFHFQVAVNKALAFQKIVVQAKRKFQIRIIKQEAGLAFCLADLDRLALVGSYDMRGLQAEARLAIGFKPA